MLYKGEKYMSDFTEFTVALERFKAEIHEKEGVDYIYKLPYFNAQLIVKEGKNTLRVTMEDQSSSIALMKAVGIDIDLVTVLEDDQVT